MRLNSIIGIDNFDNSQTHRSHPLIMYAPMGRGVKHSIHFHCVLHARKGGGVTDSMSICVHN